MNPLDFFEKKKVAIVATPRISVHFGLFPFGLSWLHFLCFCVFFSLAFLAILALGGFMCFQFGICCFTFAVFFHQLLGFQKLQKHIFV